MKKNMLISLIISFSAYIAYIGSNAQLHTFIEISQGFGFFVLGMTLILISVATILQRFNIESYVLFTPIIIMMLIRRIWSMPYDYLYDLGLGYLNYEILLFFYIITFLILIIFSLKFKQKLLNIMLIFAITGAGVYSLEAYEKLKLSYANYKYVQTDEFKNKNQKFIDSNKNLGGVIKNNFNVYHILYDSYPGKDRMKEIINYDQTGFYNKLNNRGFKTYEPAYSTGGQTFTTLSPMFNMKWKKLNEYPKYNYIGINKVFAKFIANDYKIVCDYPCYNNWGTFKWNDNVLSANSDLYFPMLNNYLHYYLGRIFLIHVDKFDKENKMFFKQIKQSDINKNYFHYIHYKSGFLLERDSHEKIRKKLSKINKQLILLIDLIGSRDKNAIIILSSDHGSRGKWAGFKNSSNAHTKFSILQAVKFPPACKRFNNIPILTSVNYYKYVFACLNGKNQPKNLQPNESIKRDLDIDKIWHTDSKDYYIFIRDNKIITPPN